MKPRFNIGQWVKIKNTTGFIREDEKRIAGKFYSGKQGQIVGARTRRLGDYVWPFDYEPCELTFTGSITVWLIAIGYLNVPLEAVEEDIELIEPRDTLPWKWTNPLPWSDEDRKQLAKWVRNTPRDAKGRWVKEKNDSLETPFQPMLKLEVK